MASQLTRNTVLVISGPIILSNISTPLLGIVDTAVIGNLGDPALIGAIAIGAMIFSFLYWGFGFLRMGTTGMIAQAKGAGDAVEIRAIFYRALLLALLIGSTLLVLAHPIELAALMLIDGSPAVESAASTYFQIRIWAAPFSLAYLVVLGYLLGQQKTVTVLWIQLILNGTNILLDLVFVIGLDWGVAGIAAATVIAEVIATCIGLWFVFRHMASSYGSLRVPKQRLKDLDALTKTFAVNRDLMIRTLCLIFAFAWFTNQGAASGDVLLATNAILLQFVTFSAFFLDGYALAAETLVGHAVGAQDQERFSLTLRYTTEIGLLTSVVIGLVFYLTGPSIIDFLTNVPEVRQTAQRYLPWVIAAPVVSLWCYLLDGIFIGATCTREMRNAMIFSLFVYLLTWYVMNWYFLNTSFENHGLWLSLLVYFVARALSLWYYLPNVRRLTIQPRS
jgi:MATE family multidrug resistance protein